MNFKSEKGVTLTSLIIYMISMLITITIITVVTGYFTKNVDLDIESYTFYSEYTKFESYFSEEVNRSNNKIIEVINGEDQNQSYVAFSSGNQYTFVPANKAIYQNNVKIASGVLNCSFEQITKNDKQAIRVNITIQGNSETGPHNRSHEFILAE